MSQILTRTTATGRMERILVVLIAGAPLALAGAVFLRYFDADEFQHLQMAWLIGQGELPYRDFFEHHVPLFHALVSPLLRWEILTTDAQAARAAVFAVREVGLGLSILILVLVYRIGLAVSGRLAALFAVALLVTNGMFIRKGIEIRPDQLGALLLLLSAWCGIRAGESARPLPWLLLVPLFGAGAALAAALLTTQKILFAAPGLGIAFLIVLLRKPGMARVRAGAAVTGLLAVAAGALAVTVPVLAVFWLGGALDAFLHFNFLLGPVWPTNRIMSLYWAKRLLYDDTVFVLLALGGGALWAIRGDRWAGAAPLAMLPLATLVLGMPLMPVAQQQYYFLFLPFAAMFAGIAAAEISRRLVDHLGPHSPAVLILPAIIAGYGVWNLAREVTVARKAETMAKLTYLVERTSPQDTVLSSWSPGIAFRRPAFFYFSLHEEILDIIPAERYRELLDGLRIGTVRPAIVDFDERLAKLPPAIVSQLRQDYEPTGVDTLWRRRN